MYVLHTYVCMSVCICTDLECMHICVCASALIYSKSYIFVRVRACACVCVHMYVCTYVTMYLSIYLCMVLAIISTINDNSKKLALLRIQEVLRPDLGYSENFRGFSQSVHTFAETVL